MRALLALLGTVAGLALLFSFKTPDQAAAPAAALPTSAAGGTPPTPTPQAAGPTPDPGAASSTSSGSSGSGSSYKDGTYNGQDVPNQFGDVQVQVIISGGKLTDVKALQLPSDRARSAEISQIAGPMLHDEAVQADSAQIDLISGATYTSDSYAQSLQSALDQAR